MLHLSLDKQYITTLYLCIYVSWKNRCIGSTIIHSRLDPSSMHVLQLSRGPHHMLVEGAPLSLSLFQFRNVINKIEWKESNRKMKTWRGKEIDVEWEHALPGEGGAFLWGGGSFGFC